MRETRARRWGCSRFSIHIAHRGVFNSLPRPPRPAEARSADVLRAMDKERKIGREKTRELLVQLVGEKTADAVLGFIRGRGSSLEETLAGLG